MVTDIILHSGPTGPDSPVVKQVSLHDPRGPFLGDSYQALSLRCWGAEGPQVTQAEAPSHGHVRCC